MNLQKTLFNYRRSQKLTQSQLAKKLKVSRAYISRIERGDISKLQSTFFKLIKLIV